MTDTNTPLSPEELADLLAAESVSGRELARALDVSPMWVSRRLRGEVPLTPEDEARVRKALDSLAL